MGRWHQSLRLLTLCRRGSIRFTVMLPLRDEVVHRFPPGAGHDTDAARLERVAAAVELAERGLSIDERANGVARLGHLKAGRFLVHRASRSTSPRLRAAAAVALGSFGEPADEVVLRQLTEDWSAQVRAAACRGLGIGGFGDATKLLLDVAWDLEETREVRSDALLAAARCAPEDLAGIVADAAGELFESGTLASGTYATALGLIDHWSAVERLEDLLETVVSSGGDPATARTVITSLSSKVVSPRAEALLVRALEMLPGARQRVCSILVHHPVEQARPALERLLEDPNDRVVSASVRALFAIGAGPSSGRLAELLAWDGWTAHTILSSLNGPEGVELAERVARRGPAGLRTDAFAVVTELDPERALVLAGDLALDFDPNVRLAAFEILVSQGERVSEWRARALSDPVPWVADQFVTFGAD